MTNSAVTLYLCTHRTLAYTAAVISCRWVFTFKPSAKVVTAVYKFPILLHLLRESNAGLYKTILLVDGITQLELAVQQAC